MKWLYLFILLGAVLASPFIQQTFQLLFTYSPSRERLYINVQGEINLSSPPEQAVLSVRIHEMSRDKAKTMITEEVVASSNKVAKLFESYANLEDPMEHPGTSKIHPRPVIDHWSMTSHTTGMDRGDYYDRQGGRVPWAETKYEAHVKDFEMLGRIVADLQRIDHVSIEDIEWTVSEQTARDLRTDARKLAVQQAKESAWTLAKHASGIDKDYVQAVDISHEYSRMPTSYAHETEISSVVLSDSWSDGRRGHKELNFAPQNVSMSYSVDMKFVAGK